MASRPRESEGGIALNAIPSQRPASSAAGKPAVHLYSTPSSNIPTASMMAGSAQFFQGQASEFNASGERLQSNDPKVLSNVSLGPIVSPSSSIGQSYLILDRNAHEIRDNEEEDPFNKFWEAVEGLVQKISGPVAFTTAPLGKSEEMRMGNGIVLTF